MNFTTDGKPSGQLFFLSPTKRKEDKESKEDQDITEIVIKKLELDFDNEADLPDDITIKGGVEVPVALHVRIRKHALSQNAVMLHSARSAMFEALKCKNKLLSPKIIKYLKETIKKSKIEWCHASAFSLSPKKFEPQVSKNLGASFDWINSFMITLETVAKHFVKRYPKKVSITPVFYMFKNTDMIIKVNYTVKILNNGHVVEAHNTVNALSAKSRRNWSSVSDSAYAIKAMQAMIDGDLGETKPKKVKLGK